MAKKSANAKLICGVCGRSKPASQMVSCETIRPRLAETLDAEKPGWRATGWVCRDDVQKYRRETVEQMILQEHGELTSLDEEVIDSLASHSTVTDNIEEEFLEKRTFGEAVADRTAMFAGSWTFIIGFFIVLVVWMAINVWPLLTRPFDPYPFILLNLVLSCIAAVQAPLIMMSQGRQEAKDRLRSENDYQVNLKAELEIRALHEKIDHHLLRQWERLSAIQEMQMELLDELGRGKVK